MPPTAASSGTDARSRSEPRRSAKRRPMSRATSTALPMPRTTPPVVLGRDSQRGRACRLGVLSAMKRGKVLRLPGACNPAGSRAGESPRGEPHACGPHRAAWKRPGAAPGGGGEPIPGPGEIVVEVHATALNRADWLQILGKYPVPPGHPRGPPRHGVRRHGAAAGPRASGSGRGPGDGAGARGRPSPSGWSPTSARRCPCPSRCR